MPSELLQAYQPRWGRRPVQVLGLCRPQLHEKRGSRGAPHGARDGRRRGGELAHLVVAAVLVAALVLLVAEHAGVLAAAAVAVVMRVVVAAVPVQALCPHQRSMPRHCVNIRCGHAQALRPQD